MQRTIRVACQLFLINEIADNRQIKLLSQMNPSSIYQLGIITTPNLMCPTCNGPAKNNTLVCLNIVSHLRCELDVCAIIENLLEESFGVFGILKNSDRC